MWAIVVGRNGEKDHLGYHALALLKLEEILQGGLFFGELQCQTELAFWGIEPVRLVSEC